MGATVDGDVLLVKHMAPKKELQPSVSGLISNYTRETMILRVCL